MCITDVVFLFFFFTQRAGTREEAGGRTTTTREAESAWGWCTFCSGVVARPTNEIQPTNAKVCCQVQFREWIRIGGCGEISYSEGKNCRISEGKISSPEVRKKNFRKLNLKIPHNFGRSLERKR